MILLCSEYKFFLGNRLFKKKDMYKYVWMRVVSGIVLVRPQIDFVLISRIMEVVGTAGCVGFKRGGGICIRSFVNGREIENDTWVG